jgi:hypothetical protein
VVVGASSFAPHALILRRVLAISVLHKEPYERLLGHAIHWHCRKEIVVGRLHQTRQSALKIGTEIVEFLCWVSASIEHAEELESTGETRLFAGRDSKCRQSVLCQWIRSPFLFDL